MRSWKKSWLIWISAGLLGGCASDAWEAPDAAFLVVDSAAVTGSPDMVGSLRHEIEAVWIFDSAGFLGAFPLKRKVPVPMSSIGRLTLKAGVRESGMANAVTPYPFFQAVTVPFHPAPWQTDTFRPTFEYSPATRFWLLENFEHGWSYWDVSEAAQATVGRAASPADVFEGDGTFEAHIQPHGLFEIITHDSFSFDTVRSSIYMELHYRTTTIMVIGAYFRQGNSRAQEALIYLRPTQRWRKLYLNFTNLLSDLTDGTTVRFFIGGWDQDSTEDRVWLDNIKVLSF